MKPLFLLISIISLLGAKAFGASCCVSNTSVPNLMIIPAKWQQTMSVSESRVIGDVDPKGQSTFRNSNNKESTTGARMDLGYGWTNHYQSGVSLRYQNKSRDFNGTSNSDSGWSDVGLSHAYQPRFADRLWFFQTLNIPTAKSVYNSGSALGVDAQGTGTYQTGVGFFKIFNHKNGDFTLGGEAHRSFARTFRTQQNETVVKPATGTSVSLGAGYVPWKAKFRLGALLTPRFEGPKTTQTNGIESKGKQSMVWDSVLNGTYSFDAQYALGVSYLDQTLFGPASNTVLSRSLSMVFQARY